MQRKKEGMFSDHWLQNHVETQNRSSNQLENKWKSQEGMSIRYVLIQLKYIYKFIS